MSTLASATDLLDFGDDAKLAARAARFGTAKPEPVRQANGNTRNIAHMEGGAATGLDLTSEEQVRKRQERAQRFKTPLVNGGQLPALTGKEADALEQRRQSAKTAERRPDTVHLHGLAKMNEDDCLQFFAGHTVLHVEWIDDNSCNVVFGSSEAARNAITSLGHLAAGHEAPDGLGFGAIEVQDATHLWHKGRGSYQSDIGSLPVNLYFRIATVLDRQQTQGKGKKAHRGKGKGRGRGSQQQHQQKNFLDRDGDVSMKVRGQKGGKRYNRNKLRASGSEDTHMQDVEEAGDPAAAAARQAEGYAFAVNHGLVEVSHNNGPMLPQEVRQSAPLDYGDI